MRNNISIQNQFNRSGLYENESVNNLIRILSRFGTIPKIYSINIISSDSRPNDFVIVPGKLLKLGVSFLKNPVVALIYLRYGIEWQIWYRALGKDKNLSVLCDIAALKVIKTFYELLAQADKMMLKKSNYYLTNFIQQNDVSPIKNLITNKNLRQELSKFHKLGSEESNFNPNWIQILNDLAEPTEFLLMSGGDFRLNIDTINLLNKYGCRPFPRPEAFTFASSTATSVSNFAFDKTERARTVLIQKSLKEGLHKGTSEYSELLKNNLRKALKISNKCQIIFSPSGTDSSLQIAAMTQIMTKNKITHILVASDETGSGVPNALKGRHFENNTALGYPIQKEDMIEGFREVELIQIFLRDDKGNLKTQKQLDNEVLTAVKKSGAKNNHVVLHAMDQSKLGYQAPSQDLLFKLNNLNSISLQIIVDGSQMRLDPKDINNYLKRGYIVTITGSKFFTGPPYAGALIVPKSMSDKINSIDKSLPEGLFYYYNQSEWPLTWKCATHLSDGFNYGTYMRWNAAIAEMDRYFRTPILYRNLGIELFCNFVIDSIKEASFMEALYKEEERINTYDDETFGLRNIRTIFPFFIVVNGKALSLEKVKKLYLLLNSDMSTYFENASIETLRLATQKCHIGQAVAVIHRSNKESAILRISLGARVISESWKDRDISMFFRNIQEQMDQITVIIRKIELILNHPDLL